MSNRLTTNVGTVKQCVLTKDMFPSRNIPKQLSVLKMHAKNKVNGSLIKQQHHIKAG